MTSPIFNIFFSFNAATLPIGAILILLVCLTSWKSPRYLALLTVVLACISYTTLVTFNLITNTSVMLNMFTLSDVMKQYTYESISAASIAHYAVGDLAVLYLMIRFLIDNQKFTWFYLPIFILTIIWGPIALLLFTLININTILS